jgi:hypothetical protein
MSTPRRKKVSDAVRILQRKRDASARATHLKAEIGMVPNSTIERKIMSTKTSIKRIALVAAAALTLGGFSVITAGSANAAATDGVAGLSFSYQPVFTGSTVSTNPGTASNPLAVSVVANSTIFVDVNETATSIDNGAAIGFGVGTSSTFNDTGTASGWVLTTGNVGQYFGDTITTTDTVTAIKVPAAATVGSTYYAKLWVGTPGVGTTGVGYIAFTVVSNQAVTYDGNIYRSAASGYGSQSVNGVAGPNNTVTVLVPKNAANGKAGFLTVSGAGATINSRSDSVAVATGATTATIAAGSSADTLTVVVNTPTAGAVTITYAAETVAGSGISATPSASGTVTVNVNATGSAGVFSAANSTFYDTTTVGASAATASLTGATGVATASNTPVALYSVTTLDALKAALAATSTSKLTAVVTGPGLLSATGNSSASAAKSVSFTSGSANNFYLYGDGTSGVATITVSLGSTVIGTKTLTFYSTTVAKLTATVDHAIVANASKSGFAADTGTAGTVDYISVIASDASGNAIPSLTNLTATSSNTSIATVGIPTYDATDKVYYVPVTGVTSGAVVVTVKDSSGAISATANLTVAGNVITTWTASTGASAYNAGDAATLLITAKDSAGNPIADGYYANALSGAFTTSQALTSTLFGSQLHFVGGVATAKFFAPYNAGTLTLTGYVGSSTTILGSDLQKAAVAATPITVTAVISGASDSNASLALDAANAATDAANNAYDEAQNATQAASDALAAVKALAVQVKALIALVTKIKNKVGA